MGRFAVGEKVKVRAAFPPTPPTHIRTPSYIRGHRGEIERICGDFPNPEQLAYGLDGLPAETLYRVRFRQKDVWPDYDGPDGDTMEIEIYDFWLEPDAGEAAA